MTINTYIKYKTESVV